MIEELNIPEIEIEGLDGIEIDIPLFENGFENRYKRVAKTGGEHPELLKYSNAEKLAKAIRLDKGARYDCIVSGNFIWGDFIEAFFTVNEAQSRSVTISTLSMDQNNVDSLKNLMVWGHIDELNLIISGYFFAHERRALIPYIYQELDIDNRFQLAVADVHTKICLFETTGGKKIIIHGSSNLRSSGSIEQFTIEENPDLYDFYKEYHDRIIEKYKMINKDVKRPKRLRGKALWEAVNGRDENQ